MKRFLMSALLASLLLVPASVAQAKWEKGSYSGRTADGKSNVSFQATRRAAKTFAFNKVKVACSDGIARFASLREFLPMRVNSTTGRFKGKSPGFDERLTAPVDFAVSVRGRLLNKRSSGTMRVFYRTTPEGALSQTGSITCDSGSVAWRAETFSLFS
jgi:hypothetical protein